MPEDKNEDAPTLMDKARNFKDQLTRTKTVGDDVMDTHLRRCLTTFDVTLLSLGHMVGSGVYVLTPTVAKSDAGPAVVISYLISGIASFLAALCYAELGVRYPRAGSAYSYTYLALGELWAFLVGWNVALENVIGVAAIGRACSDYIDGLANKFIQNGTDAAIGVINNPVINRLDFLSLAIVVLFLIFLSFGVQMTAGLNNAFSLINMTAIILVICVGGYYADIKNWTNKETGGFMPYGWAGVFKGAATCFYAYVGFDSIAASGEEAKDPTKSIPFATMVSMAVAAILYICVGAVLTLMVNYKEIEAQSGLPAALQKHGAGWAKIAVSIGAICGMATGIIGSLYALTRVIYVMADDGLLFPFCAKVNQKSQIPIQAMFVFGSFAAVMTFCFDVEVLSKLMSIGTLFAYLVVSTSVIVIRYRPMLGVPETPKSQPAELSSVTSDNGKTGQGNEPTKSDDHENESTRMPNISEENENTKGGGKTAEKISSREDKASAEESAPKEGSAKEPPSDDPGGRMYDRFASIEKYINWKPGRFVVYCTFFFVIFVFVTCIVAKTCAKLIVTGVGWAILLLILALAGLGFFFTLILMHRESSAELNYKVPLAPLTPALSIACNAWLIVNFELETFVRLIIWIVVGLLIYLPYGRNHSKLNKKAPPVGTSVSDQSLKWFSWSGTDLRKEQQKKDNAEESKNKPGSTNN